MVKTRPFGPLIDVFEENVRHFSRWTREVDCNAIKKCQRNGKIA